MSRSPNSATRAGYENVKARLEGLSNSITDKIFRYWRQNQELDVEFDIRPDPKDNPPFNNGPNLYIRNIMGSDAKTIFPLQAALGYTIAQNLFISKRNLLVEGPADLIYLRFFSDVLESQGRQGLRDDITLVPAGGLDKVATFIALLGANELEIGVVHDTTGKPDQHLDSLIRQKLIRERQVLNCGMFRSPVAKGKGRAGTPPPAPVATDVEDLFKPTLYLSLFSAAFEKGLGGAAVSEADLPPGDRVVDRINRYLTAKSISLRPSGGFNHYAVANYLASNPLRKVDKDTLDRFEALFGRVNALFSED